MSRPHLSFSRPSIVLLILAIFGFQRCASISQTSTPNEPQKSFQLQVQSNLVLVRVVVRDKSGKPIRGLKKEEFRLFDQGKEQSISHFEEVSNGAPSSAQATNAPTAPTPLSATDLAARPRYIALYFDDLNSSPADLILARDAANHFLTSSLRPDDRVAIFTAERMLSDFTADPRQIHEALSKLQTSARGQQNDHPCPDISDYQAYEILHTNDPTSDAWMTALAEAAACPVKIVAGLRQIDPNKPSAADLQPIRMLARKVLDQAQDLARANLHQFEQVVKAIAPAPGERSIVLVSPGFLSQSEQYTLERVIDRALRAQIVIDSLDPKGLAILLRESDASNNATVLPDPRATQARYHLDVAREFAGADVLAEFAQGTGGEFFHSNNDLKAGFASLFQDPPHYILAFSPQKVKWDGKYHSLKVAFSAKEKGLTIQARRGYFAIEDRATLPEIASSPTVGNAPAAAAASASQPTDRAATTPTPVSLANPGTGPPTNAADVASPPFESEPMHLHRGKNRMTVDQLKHYVLDGHARSDAELAKQLGRVELTERLDSPTLLRLEATLPGARSKQALIAQADTAAFLNPAQPDSPLPDGPSAEDERQWLKSAIEYVNNTLHKLPNFFATRDVARFADSPARQEMGVFYSYQPLHFIDRVQGTVFYRDGKQVLDAVQRESTVPDSASPGLLIEGEFGPMLGTVLTDASNASLTWSHWQPGTTGPLAIYRFAVPRNKSHYEVEYCCVNEGSTFGLFKQIPAYHGEIAIDPATGAVLRIAIQADLKDSYPLIRADLLVEYGNVEIGGKTYICPLRSVAILKAYSKAPDLNVDMSLIPGTAAGAVNTRDLPVKTMINDIEFEQYHLFRSESRILPTADE